MVVVTVTNAVIPPAGLAAWWCAESNALDSVGFNHGTPCNVSYPTGKVGQAFGFNGTNSYVFVPASTSLDVGQSNGFTVEAWVKLNDDSTPQPIAQWTDGTNRGVSLWVGSPDGECGNGYVYCEIVDTDLVVNSLCSGSQLYNTNYHHVAITFSRDPNDFSIWIDGDSVASSGPGDVELLTVGNVYIGYSPSLGGSNVYYFNGSLDEVSIYNRALSGEEIFFALQIWHCG